MRTSLVGPLALTTLLLSGSTSAEGQPPSDAELASRIDALTAPQEEAGVLSGVIAVSREGEIVFERAYGFASWELRARNSASTRFGVASITKVMTEALVRLLVQEGRLALEAPVESYLPGFPRGPDGGVPTVGQLLVHRAGVAHRVTEAIEETRALGPADIVERVVERGLLFEPGAQRLYSSAGYTCLARVIEIVEGQSFDRILEARVFEPAGMSSATSETGPRLMMRRARPHRLGADGGALTVANAPGKDLRFLTGAGSVYATAGDLVRLVEAIRHGVFGTGLRDDMLGLEGEEWWSATGRTNGYEASVDSSPARGLSVVFLSNLQSAANWQVREQVRRIVLGEEPEAIPPPPPVARRFEDPAALVGTYGRAEISLVDGHLFRGDNEFYPIEGERYYIPASGSMMRFRRDSTGTVDAVVAIRDDGEESVLPRSP